MRIPISAKVKTSGLLPDMASVCYKARCARADVCFGVLLHTIACADRHPVCLYRLEYAIRLGASEGASRLYGTLKANQLFDVEVFESLRCLFLCEAMRISACRPQMEVQYLSDVTPLTATVLLV